MKSTKVFLPTLYKRSNQKDNINQWDMTIDGDSYYSTSGYVGMKQFQNEPTRCVGKNIGKKNETTPEQQAIFEATQMWAKRKDLGYHENINDCDIQIYFSPMLAQDFNKIKSKVDLKLGVWSDPKLDGIRCITKSDGMYSRNGKPLLSTPHIFESLKHLFDDNEDLILDGELYCDKSLCDFNMIVSCVRKTKPTKEDLELSKQYIKYYIYDIPSEIGVFSKRKQELYKLELPNTCVIVKSDKCFNISELDILYGKYINEGYEGQMVRTDSEYETKRSKSLMKRKEFIDEEYEILGVKEGIGKLSGKVGALFLNHKGKPFECAVNGSHEYLEILFNDDKLIGKLCTVRYFEITEYGSPRFPKCIAIRDYE